MTDFGEPGFFSRIKVATLPNHSPMPRKTTRARKATKSPADFGSQELERETSRKVEALKCLDILCEGVDAWNDWRKENPEVSHPILRGAELFQMDLAGVDLSGADLSWAELFQTNFTGADLSGADLEGANLSRANLGAANLRGANLSGAQLIAVDLRDAMLTGSFVHGVSVWDVKVNDCTKQQNLVITGRGDPPVITVDNIKVAQFIYLLLNNQEIRDVIHAITSQAVLILGRFSKKRKPVLDAIQNELRKHNYLPISV